MGEKQIKKTILIVEDDLPVLNALVDKLNREGFNILQAKNGEDGFIMANKNHPDIILLDIIMPKMDGLTMMKKLRAEDAWGKSVPIIILTNLSNDGETIDRSIMKDKPACYLIKTDWSMTDVVEKIKQQLSK